MSASPIQLTKFPSGSLKEIARISFPLMINALSANLMIFFDRLILGKYNVDAMAAVTGIWMIIATFQFGGMGITAIAEVFVGQHNGAGHKDKIATPVWQMIWFALFLNVIYWPVGFFLGQTIIAPPLIEHGIDFFEIMMAFVFLMPLLGAISSFYIGRGQVRIVTLAAVTGNILNIMINYCLILGVDGVIEPLGAKGAAIGTVIAVTINFMIMFLPFLFAKENKQYHTKKAGLNWPVMLDCLRVGTPTAIGHTIEIAGWSAFTYMLATKSKDYFMVFTISNTLFLLFVFMIDGLQKGVTAVASNFIGSQHADYISKTFFAALRLVFILAVLIMLSFVLFSDLYIGLFLDINQTDMFLWQETKIACLVVCLIFAIDGFTWILAGVLTAGGDTKYIMYVNIFSAWVLVILPTYIWLNYFPSKPSDIYVYLLPSCVIVNAGLMFWRYKSNKWIKVDLSD